MAPQTAGATVGADMAEGLSGSDDPVRHAESIVRRSGTSFYWAMRLLPAPRRDAMFAIYAFCREVDDVADDEAPSSDKLRRLDAWRDEVDRIFAGRPQWPTGRALLEPVRRFDLPKREFIAMIEGMEMDAREAMCAPSLDDLMAYCRRVAGAVGMLSIRIFGDAGETAQSFAVATGDALQLTNILRDIDEDAARGRLYIPAELLEAAGVTGRGPDAIMRAPGFPDACAQLAGKAADRFAEAQRLLESCDRAKLRPAIIMAAVYARILERLRARGWSDRAEPVSISKPERLWIALRHLLVP